MLVTQLDYGTEFMNSFRLCFGGLSVRTGQPYHSHNQGGGELGSGVEE